METEEIKKQELNKINLEETRRLKLAETLKEAVRTAGDYRMLSKVFEEDKELNAMFEKGAKDLNEFSQKLSAHLSTL